MEQYLNRVGTSIDAALCEGLNIMRLSDGAHLQRMQLLDRV